MGHFHIDIVFARVWRFVRRGGSGQQGGGDDLKVCGGGDGADGGGGVLRESLRKSQGQGEVGVVGCPQCCLFGGEDRDEGGGESQEGGVAVVAFQDRCEGGAQRRQQGGDFKLVVIRGAGGQGEAGSGALGKVEG